MIHQHPFNKNPSIFYPSLILTRIVGRGTVSVSSPEPTNCILDCAVFSSGTSIDSYFSPSAGWQLASIVDINPVATRLLLPNL